MSVTRPDSRSALFSAATLLATGLSLGMGAPASAQKALFLAKEVPQERFILVAAPIGSGERAQLNIYEQLNDRRLCFSTSGVDPVIVNPLLGTFDFTGICNRFIDANGFSLRIGEVDLATNYRLSVVRQQGDTVLLAVPLKATAGPELLIARTHGTAPGFLQLRFEPGWALKRRHFGPRPLGHVYIHREPAAETATTPAPATVPAAAAATPAAPAATPKAVQALPGAQPATQPVTRPVPRPVTQQPATLPVVPAPAAAVPAVRPQPAPPAVPQAQAVPVAPQAPR